MSDATDAIAKYQTAIDLYRAGVRFSAAEFMAMPPEEQAIFAAAGDAVEKSRTEALAASTRSRVAVGEPADLVAIERDPLVASGDELRGMPVALTLLGGRPTWQNL